MVAKSNDNQQKYLRAVINSKTQADKGWRYLVDRLTI